MSTNTPDCCTTDPAGGNLRRLTREDFQSPQEVKWCPGCGNFSILAQVQNVLPRLGIPREKAVFVSGIGCSIVPMGLDFVFLPNSEVGEYCPLVSP